MVFHLFRIPAVTDENVPRNCNLNFESLSTLREIPSIEISYLPFVPERYLPFISSHYEVCKLNNETGNVVPDLATDGAWKGGLDTAQRILLQNFNTPTETVFFQEPSSCNRK
ncbi:hypothetical protein NQ318_019704 [Aromia moschata]|uniref:Uncharacterized protein n=1 Tax=Aromia moschata TaxID=1265417 RepID=A0AAV8Z480_9CUCU|nr:hypothetical protein NQ318_019704 [Aromia moschata]